MRRPTTTLALFAPTLAVLAACSDRPDAQVREDGGLGGRDSGVVSRVDGAVVSMDAAPAAPSVGAKTPFVSFEAESGVLAGGAVVVALTTPPTSRYSSPELEASGHAFAKLAATGQSVEWINTTGHDVTFINVRASIPDAPTGGGITATLSLYVNGARRQALSLNSKQSWGYEGNGHDDGDDTQDPADGEPRTFFDDAHAFIQGTAVAPGDTLRLQKDAGDDAAFYDLDVVDLEAPPPPGTRPGNALSITDYGAVADDLTIDNSAAIQRCIDDAQSKGMTVWIPRGTFTVRSTGGLNAAGITIQGAGMWYSTLYRNLPLPNTVPLGAILNLSSCTVRDFALDANARSRASVDGAGGGMDTTGDHWLADGIWTQHTESGFWGSGTHGTVQNCRLTSIWADGCNLNNVSRGATVGADLTAQNNFVRGTGDDGMAINSVAYNGAQTYTPMSNVQLLDNTVVAPWGGKAIAVYGGSGHRVQNNLMHDTARYIGLGIGKFGVNGSDLLSAAITGNLVVRCGGNGYDQRQPALHIGNGGDGQGVGIVSGVIVSGNTVVDALFDGVAFSTSSDVTFADNRIVAPGLGGIVVAPPFYPAPSGSAQLTDNIVSNLADGQLAFENDSAGFTVTGSGNSW